MIAIDEIDDVVQAIDLTGQKLVISPDKIIIDKQEYKELRQKAENQPVFWKFNDAQHYMGVGANDFKTILYDPKIKKELDIEHGGCVRYWSKGSQYYFLRDEFKKYVDKNKERLMAILCH